jgi:hypothetical protein
MTIQYSDLREGMRILVSNGGGMHEGTIDELERNIKHGEPGAGYVLDNGEGYWCYVYQIKRIL